MFYTEVVEDVNASRLAGRPVMIEEDRIEYRIAGNRNFTPHVQAHEFHEWVDGVEVTHAMRWPDEYRKFKETGGNTAKGTPLENLPGLTPVQKSTLKALSVFSIEALANMEGRELKNLGPGGHEMKRSAQQYLDVGSGRVDMSAMLQEIAEVKAQNAELAKIVNANRPQAVEQPHEPVFPNPAEQEQDALDEVLETVDPYALMSDEDMKTLIKDKTGSGVRGQPSRQTLIGMLKDLEA